jgi:hypothetical protein
MFWKKNALGNNIFSPIQKVVKNLVSQVGHADAVHVGIDEGNG